MNTTRMSERAGSSGSARETPPLGLAHAAHAHTTCYTPPIPALPLPPLWVFRRCTALSTP